MNEKAPPPEESLPLEVLREIHQACRRFEAEWKAGRTPRIEDYLGDTPEPARSQLRKDLESLDAEYRKPKSKVSVETFIKRLVESGLMTAAECQAFLDSLPPEKRPADGEQLAQELYRQKKITKFQAQAVYQGKTRGLVVGNYVVLDTLGKGGMGYVYKAQHRKMKRVVALKMLPSSAMRSEEAVKRFQREVEAAAKLSHPNIVTAYDADEHQGVHFFAMEYVDGKDLAHLVKQKGTLAVAKAVDYVLQAARGLDYAHRHGVIHRDIKPSNLLLDGQGTVKILDMGLARIDEVQGAGDAAAREGLTQTGQVMGTLDFMAPEQALDTHQADARADIYALGCTLYYLLVGHVPYGGDTVGKKIVAHREDPIPSLRASRPDVPEALDALFCRMMAKRAEDRPRSMAEVIAALEACPAGGEQPAVEHPAGEVAETFNGVQSPEVPTDSQMVSSPQADDLIVGQSVYLPPQFAAAPKPATRNRRRQGFYIGIGAATLFVAILLGIVIELRTKDGMLLIEIDEPGCTVKVLNEEGAVEIQRPGGKGSLTIRIGPGNHRLRVEKDGREPYVKDFAMANRGNETVRVQFPPPPIPRGPEPPRAIAPFDAAKAKEHQQAWAKYLGIPVEITNSIGMKFVLIPPGEFTMGESAEEMEKVHGGNPRFTGKDPPGPQHRVRISKPFYLGVTEVTQEAYERVMGNNPSEFSPAGAGKDKVRGADTKRFPVETVSWDEAVEFCRRLSGLPEERAAGRRYDLPWEAQWESACRAGSAGRWCFSRASVVRLSPEEAKQEENLFAEYGWYGGNSAGTPHPVGLKRANAWGLYDMHGNVNEWCRDGYDKDYYAKSPIDDPAGSPDGSSRVTRGGGWPNLVGSGCRSAHRGGGPSGGRDCTLGFRAFMVPADPHFAVSTVAAGQRTSAAAAPGTSQTAQAGGAVESPRPKQSPVAQPGAPPPAVAPFDAAKAKEYQQAWAQYLGVPVEITNSIGMKLVLIPPGEYMMGSSKEVIEKELNSSHDESYKARVLAEGPQHLVRITVPFYFGSTEVTQEEYQRTRGTNPSWFVDGRKQWGGRQPVGPDTTKFPVECIRRGMAVEFCRHLSESPEETAAHRVYRLPTEAEWEWSCRAGKPGSSNFHSGGRTHEVAESTPNAWGLYDTYGNVWEWCSDLYDAKYYANSPVDDPKGPTGGSLGVIRGGSWFDRPERSYLRSELRFAASLENAGECNGFRVVCEIAFDASSGKAMDRAKREGSH